jgi:hypothetical protein
MIWERCIAAGVRDTNDNHDIGLAVNDTFVPGRGQLWLELDVEEVPADDGSGDSDAEDYQDDGDDSATPEIKWVSAPLVRVPYRDYLEGYATRWGSVPWVARAHLFTRDDLVAICGLSEDEARDVPLNAQICGEDGYKKRRKNKKEDQFSRARVWEIWTKFPKKARLYVAEDYKDRVLCSDPDPYGLKKFFPCPRPLLANGDEGWQDPITDYSRYEDQAKELDVISARIYVLTATLRRRGVYDKNFKQIADLAEADDNVFLPVENWQELQAKAGPLGLAGVMMTEDISVISNVLAQLQEQRRTLIDLIYELSGISDLARGMTDPRETLGAQQLKMSFGAGRFKHRETESRRFAAEAYEIKGEIIAEMFPREQLAEMSGIPLPTQKEIDAARAQMQQIQKVQSAQQQLTQMQAAAQQPPQAPPQQGQDPSQQAPGQQQPAPPPPQPDPQQIEQLVALAQTPLPPDDEMSRISDIASTKFSWEKISKVLRSDYRRCYSVEVETDQTNFIDEEADKQSRIDLVDMINRLMVQFGPFIQGNPANGEMVKKLIMFAVSAFRSGRAIEEDIELSIDNAVKMAAQTPPQQQPEDPMLQTNLQLGQLEIQSKQFELEGKKQAMAQLELKNKQIEMDAQSDREDRADQRSFERMKYEKDLAFKIADQEMAERKLAIEQEQVALQRTDLAMKQQQQIFDQTHAAEQQAFDRELAVSQHQFQQQDADRKFKAESQNADRQYDLSLDQHEHAKQQQSFDQTHASRIADDNLKANGLKRKKGEDGKDVVADAHDERMGALANHLSTHLAKQDERMAKVISAPKRVVRGPDGKVSHVETVMEAV